VQHIDFYGNTTSFMIQTVRTDEGVTAFVTQVNAQGSVRYILPCGVLAVLTASARAHHQDPPPPRQAHRRGAQGGRDQAGLRTGAVVIERGFAWAASQVKGKMSSHRPHARGARATSSRQQYLEKSSRPSRCA
jgi:hypothetical protein